VGVSQSQGTDFAVDADESAVTLTDVRNQLFNSQNVVLNPDRSDRGLSTLTHPPSIEGSMDEVD
jgi:hypothetical protein